VGLHVRVLGQGTRSILLLHGLAGSNRYFGASFDALAASARVIAPDLLGFGQSPRPADCRYDADAHSQAIESSLDRLHVTAPLFVVAHSVGCLVALRLATRRPHMVRGVVAVSPPFYPSPEAARARISALGLLVRWFALDRPLARWVCAWMCRNRSLAAKLSPWLRRDLPPEIARDAVLHNWMSYSSTLGQLVLTGQPPDELRELSAPLLALAGEADRVLDLAYLRELSESRARVELRTWPGAGHDLPLSHPDPILAEIERHLDAWSVETPSTAAP
jgi:pimeloyl-ACP methyl ester carboxylesterase